MRTYLVIEEVPPLPCPLCVSACLFALLEAAGEGRGWALVEIGEDGHLTQPGYAIIMGPRDEGQGGGTTLPM
jgi:hypothetical protein